MKQEFIDTRMNNSLILKFLMKKTSQEFKNLLFHSNMDEEKNL